MLRRSPTARWQVATAWLLATGGLVGYAWVGGTVLAALDAGALVAVAALAAPILPARLPAPAGDLTVPLLLVALLIVRPARDAVLAGALTPCAVALVLYGAPAPRPWRTDGLALAAAVAIAPPWAVFAALPWRAGRRVAAVIAVVGGGTVTALRWAVSGGSWLRLLSGPVPAGVNGRLDDVSVHGILLRLGLSSGLLLACWLAVVAAVVVLAVVRVGRYAGDAQPLLALGVLGCAAVAATPIAWSYALIWLLPAAAGRLGRRAEDRALWPVVAIVPTLLTSWLFDPKIDPVTSFVLRNSPGLLAVLAAAALPFRMRSDPHWQARRPAIAGTRGLLPGWLRSARRPNLMLELLFIQVGYGVYTWIRNAGPNRVREAQTHGEEVFDAERLLHLDVEHGLNRLVQASDWLDDALEHYYKTLHFAVPLAVLAWLYWRRPERYRPARSVLFATTGLALIGFWAYPLAPPRLTPGHGFQDTLHPDSNPFGAFTKLANQFAAMPSLHIAWSTWCALVLVTAAPYLWVRVLGAIYPITTLVVVLGTANHWLLDAVGAFATLAAAYLIQYLLTAEHPFAPTRTPGP
jgi:PAP2 superfamily